MSSLASDVSARQTAPPRLLLVEDDDVVREGVASALGAHGYLVEAAVDGRDIDELLQQFRPDLAILDVTLPVGPDGFALATAIRSRTTIPVIFLTAADSLEDRVRGFDLGADDYLVKPFSTAELVVRIRAVLRRVGRAVVHLVRLGDVQIDLTSRSAMRGDHDLALTPTEFDLLAVLTSEPGRVWTKRELLEEVWGVVDHAPHMVEVHISGLRRKLEEHGPRIVVTRRGGGYSVNP